MMSDQCCCVPLNHGLANRVGSGNNSTIADSADNSVEIKAGLCNADPITKQGKRVQMIQMLCIPLIPIIILVVQACLSLADAIASKVQLHITR